MGQPNQGNRAVSIEITRASPWFSPRRTACDFFNIRGCHSLLLLNSTWNGGRPLWPSRSC
jgi:hypothetical protein